MSGFSSRQKESEERRKVDEDMSLELAGFSSAAADAVERAGASVVRVDGRNRDAASGIVWSAEGLVVTANHVLERNEGILVGDAEGNDVAAEIVGRDPSTDIALLRAASGGLAAEWRSDGDARVGEFVWAVARPGRTLQSTLGVVSSLRKTKGSHGGAEGDLLIQTDVLMYPGFSGGALITASGHVIGLNSSALRRGASAALAFATVDRVVRTLLEHGRMPRGFLGVGLQPVRLGSALAEAAGQESGLMVMSVESGGPAAQAGIAQGDVLLALDDVKTRTLDDLMRGLEGDRAGKSASLQIARGGAVQTVGVTVGSR